MKTPIAWLRDYVDLPHDTQTIVEKLASLGFPVDAIEERPAISGVVVGRITAIEKHPNADRLQICTIDIGGEKPLTIATAATNVAVDQIIPVATIGAVLAGGMKIEPRAMRGVDSQGMLCSAGELGLEAEWFEDGIMQLDVGTRLGADVVSMFRLGDAVLDVDVTSNRVDAMCMLGLARELGAGFGVPVREPDTTVSYGGALIGGDLVQDGELVTDSFDSFDIKVKIESPDCSRFVVQRVSRVRVRTAKAWMRVRLALAGQRPIDNVVDISNFVMLETSQPLHFYDFEKLVDRTLVVRDARDGETMTTLDEADRVLSPAMLVIADGEGPQSIAGLKGGARSEVSAATREIAIEAANFSGPRIRRMSAALGLRTEASTRHEKSLARALTDIGAARAARLLEQEGAVVHMPRGIGAVVGEPPIIDVRKNQIARLLGFDLDNDAAIASLHALGFTATTMLTPELIAMLELEPDDIDEIASFEVQPPPWRSDVTTEIDVIEEIARIAGYDRIPTSIPAVRAQSIDSDAWRLQARVARAVAALGYHEVLTLALQPASIGDRWKASGVDVHSGVVEITNPLSEDQRYMRFSLVPGMLALPIDRMFEIGDIFAEYRGEHIELTTLVFMRRVATPRANAWSDDGFDALKGDALAFVRSVTGRAGDIVRATHAGWHPGICADITVEGKAVATIGALDPRLGAEFEVEDRVYVAQVMLDVLPAYVAPHYAPPSRYPGIVRDLAFIVGEHVAAAALEATVLGASPLVRSARSFDEYRSAAIGADKKSIAIRIGMGRNESTLTDADADAAIASTTILLQAEHGAIIRS